MKEKLLDILRLIDDEIIEYAGENLFEEGLMDSLTVIMLVGKIENDFEITIDASYVVEENFKSIDNMLKLIEKVKNDE